MAVFHNVIIVSAHNAFVMWREINLCWMPDKRNKNIPGAAGKGTRDTLDSTKRASPTRGCICGPCERYEEEEELLLMIDAVLCYLLIQLWLERPQPLQSETEVRSVPQIKTVKRILCAVAVTNMYAEAVHACTAPSALTLPLVNAEQQTKCGTSVCIQNIPSSHSGTTPLMHVYRPCMCIFQARV